MASSETQHEREVRLINKIFGQLQTSTVEEKDANLENWKTVLGIASSDPNNNSGNDSIREKEKSLEEFGEGFIRWRWIDPVSKQEYTGSRRVMGRHEIIEQKRRLPIYQFKKQFLHAVTNNQVVVVVGETGSGKSTQMPQYLLEAGMVVGRVAVTQPRRVAAVSVAQRVAEELGCPLGDLVGYSIRFEDLTSTGTVLKYMTDGIMLMECLKDSLFSNYGCIILDEAHERTLHTDVLLGLLKKALRERPDLKLIITSATLDIKKFADYFDAPMVKIPGKMFPVQIKFLPEKVFCPNSGRIVPAIPLAARTKKTDLFVDAAVSKVLSIHDEEFSKKGDILLFLPGKEEVEQACSLLVKLNKNRDLMVLPVYAALPFEAQCEIFCPSNDGVRKVIVATNIAETSLTINGIIYVVDTGYFKESIYDRGIDTLKVTVISKAQAEQRSGRAGRTAPGLCFRMYTLSDYQLMATVPAPAIHRIDLTATTLQLKAMGINDICGFGFMDPPKPDRVRYSLCRLKDLGALDFRFEMTDLGYKMAEFPLSPNLAKILLTAAEMGCSDEVLTIVSMLSVNYIFVRPKKRQREADFRKKQFDDFKGDHLSLLNVYNAWIENKKSEEWAKNHFVHQKELEKALDIRCQLHSLMEVHGVPMVSTGGRHLSNIRRALSTGSPNNVAYRDETDKNAYRTLVDRKEVFIHPSSALFKVNPELVIYHETTTTSRNFMRIVSVCEKSWVGKLLPNQQNRN